MISGLRRRFSQHYDDLHKSYIRTTSKLCLKRCSHCARHRMTSDDVVRCRYVVVRCRCNWTHWLFTYHTMSYDVATTLTQVQFLRQSHDVVRYRPTSCAKASSAVVRCRAQCEHRFTLITTLFRWSTICISCTGAPWIDSAWILADGATQIIYLFIYLLTYCNRQLSNRLILQVWFLLKFWRSSKSHLLTYLPTVNSESLSTFIFNVSCWRLWKISVDSRTRPNERESHRSSRRSVADQS